MKKNKIKFCTNCGNLDEGQVGGSIFITLLLLLFYIIPGLIYEIWRTSKKRLACKKCGKRGLIPEDSPIAQKFLNDNV